MVMREEDRHNYLTQTEQQFRVDAPWLELSRST
jgi:hypothetical protein